MYTEIVKGQMLALQLGRLKERGLLEFEAARLQRCLHRHAHHVGQL